MTTFRGKALLFDLDGTLIDSLPAVDRAWGKWSERHGMDPSEVIPKIHGRRSIDSVRDLLPDANAEEEDAWIRRMEASDTEGVRALPGALEAVKSLTGVAHAYVTSGTSDVATARLTAVGFPIPQASVFGEDVANGKPAPDPFLLAARRLDVDPADCIVFEDTPAGIRSGKAAGATVIGISTWKVAEELSEAAAVVPDFRHIRVETDGDQILVYVSEEPFAS